MQVDFQDTSRFIGITPPVDMQRFAGDYRPEAADLNFNIFKEKVLLEYSKMPDDAKKDGVVVLGLWSPNFNSTVTQQAKGNYGYVDRDELTQFGLATESIGLLNEGAINPLVNKIGTGDVLFLVMSDGSVNKYKVVGLTVLVAEDPLDQYSDFYDAKTGKRYYNNEVFNMIYGGINDLVLQECGGVDGEKRIFLLADEVDSADTSDKPNP